MPAASPVKVTVLMTLYNKGPYVEEAIRSVLQSTFKDFELLVVDDRSTDDGLERVLRSADPRIRVLTHPVNTGRAAAATRGIRAARGQYLAILDADDVMLPERLQRQVELMDRETDVIACGSQAEFMDDGSPVGKWPEDDKTCRAMALFGDPVLYPTAIFRTASLLEAGLFPDPEWRRPGMDYLFLLKIATLSGMRFVNLPEVLTLYRRGEQNMRHGRDAYEDRKAIYREVFRRYGKGVSEEELDLQMFIHGLGGGNIQSIGVPALFRWKKKLLGLKGTAPIFPEHGFEKVVEERWDRAFHRIADRSPSAGVLHLIYSRDLRPARIYYLLTRLLNSAA